MRRVILESPYSARSYSDAARNMEYGRMALRDCLSRGESPIASHLLYTQPGVLDDDVPEDRTLGIVAGHAWMSVADACVVYVDHGISPGMQEGIDRAEQVGIPVEKRQLFESKKELV